MKEEFLHYLWKYSLYYSDKLTDNEGNKITVISPGEYNHDSGPDFFNARIRIGGTEWAGNVEIHIKSSHFNNHGHNRDHAFNNVILHVVCENDRRVFNAKNEELLTAEISYDPALYERYTNLLNNPCVIACQNEVKKLDRFFILNWLQSLLVERLEVKSSSLLEILKETGNDWDETFYRILSRYFGFRVNTEPFEMLASAIPFRIIRKHANDRFQIEALLFGTAGLLEEGLFRDALSDKYYRDLIKEYRVLSAKYNLKPVHGWLWKFSRLRPVNFPTIRISQLSDMLTVSGGLFSRVLHASSVKELREQLESKASPYWDDHFVFGRKSKRISKKTGCQAAEIFLINAIIPIMFIYGRTHDSQEVCERALDFLDEIAPEVNSIISDWKSVGIEPDSAFYSQALIHLTEEYCKKRKCLECRIGCKVISMGRKLLNNNELILEP
jgi:hypothetical protein